MDKGAGKILVFGATGQIGSALAGQLGPDALAVTEAQADYRDLAGVERVLDTFHRGGLRAVINAAAYTAVDKAETPDQRGLARQLNAVAPGFLAQWCAERGIHFVHYSTDYVYPGDGTEPWDEDDMTGPLSVYGATKLEGDCAVAETEELARKNGGGWLILRTSWVFDALGSNFVRTMLRLGGEREILRVVSDQVGAPSYAPHLAAATLRCLEQGRRAPEFPSGVYHLRAEGLTSWHGFAEKIFELARKNGITLKVRKVEAIPTSAYPTPALRPLNSRLSGEKLRRVFGVELPSWEAGLGDCLNLIARGESGC